MGCDVIIILHALTVFTDVKKWAFKYHGYNELGWQFLAVNWLRPSDAYMRQKLTIIGSDNGLSPGRRQALIWTNAGILLTGPLRTKFNDI